MQLGQYTPLLRPFLSFSTCILHALMTPLACPSSQTAFRLFYPAPKTRCTRNCTCILTGTQLIMLSSLLSSVGRSSIASCSLMIIHSSTSTFCCVSIPPWSPSFGGTYILLSGVMSGLRRQETIFRRYARVVACAPMTLTSIGTISSVSSLYSSDAYYCILIPTNQNMTYCHTTAGGGLPCAGGQYSAEFGIYCAFVPRPIICASMMSIVECRVQGQMACLYNTHLQRINPKPTPRYRTSLYLFSDQLRLPAVYPERTARHIDVVPSPPNNRPNLA